MKKSFFMIANPDQTTMESNITHVEYKEDCPLFFDAGIYLDLTSGSTPAIVGDLSGKLLFFKDSNSIEDFCDVFDGSFVNLETQFVGEDWGFVDMEFVANSGISIEIEKMEGIPYLRNKADFPEFTLDFLEYIEENLVSHCCFDYGFIDHEAKSIQEFSRILSSYCKSFLAFEQILITTQILKSDSVVPIINRELNSFFRLSKILNFEVEDLGLNVDTTLDTDLEGMDCQEKLNTTLDNSIFYDHQYYREYAITVKSDGKLTLGQMNKKLHAFLQHDLDISALFSKIYDLNLRGFIQLKEKNGDALFFTVYFFPSIEYLNT